MSAETEREEKYIRCKRGTGSTYEKYTLFPHQALRRKEHEKLLDIISREFSYKVHPRENGLQLGNNSLENLKQCKHQQRDGTESEV